VSKRARIEASSYLSHAHRKFENIQGSLFIYGSSLSSQDDHIWDAIASNTTLARLFVGLRGSASSKGNKVIIARTEALAAKRKQILAAGRSGGRSKKVELEVHFFDTESAGVWTAKATTGVKAA
jgi:hypothetical protein